MPRDQSRFFHYGVGEDSRDAHAGSEVSIKLGGHLPSGLWPPENQATRDSSWHPQGLVTFPRLP